MLIKYSLNTLLLARHNQLIIMDINDRVKLLMDTKQLSSSEFAERTGIQQSTFSHFINGRNKASLDVVTKIHESFDNVSLEWLLYGRGEMFGVLSQNNGTSPTHQELNNRVNYSNNNSSQQSLGFSSEALGVIAPMMAHQAQNSQSAEPAKPPRKITEIRVFFDDNTFEIFKLDK